MQALIKIFGLIFGLAGVIALAWQFSDAFGFWTALLLFLLLSILMLLVIRFGLLRFPIICTTTTIILEFKDSTGDRVDCLKEQTFCPVWEHITRISEYIQFDGSLEGFSAELKSAQSSWRVLHATRTDQSIAHEFDRPLMPLKLQTRIIKYTYRNSFTNPHEFCNVDAWSPGAIFTIQLRFPKTRPPKNIDAFRILGAISFATKEIKLDHTPPEFVVAEFKVYGLAAGQKYRIEWDW